MPHPQHLVAVTLTPDGAADDVDDDDDSAWLQQLQGREADACWQTEAVEQRIQFDGNAGRLFTHYTMLLSSILSDRLSTAAAAASSTDCRCP